MLAAIPFIVLAACSDNARTATGPSASESRPAFAVTSTGTTSFTSVMAAGKCLSVQGTIAAGATTVLRTCDGSASQQFTVGSAGDIRIGTSLCLDDFGGAGANGDKIGIWTCKGGANQTWTLTSASEIRGLGKCVDVYGAQSTDGTPIILWDCHGGSNQKWTTSFSTSTAPAPVPVATVSTTVGSTTLPVGGTTQAVAVLRDASGNTLTGRTVTWSSSNTGVATVSTSGLVTAVAAGSAAIVATSEGKTGSVTISVTAPVTLTGVPIVPGQSIQAAVDANPAGTAFVLKAGTHTNQTVTPKAGDTFTGETGAVMDGQNVTQFAFKGKGSAGWVNNVTLRNFKITRYAPPSQNGAVWGGDDRANGTSGWVLDGMDISYNKNLAVRIGNRMRVLNSKLHHNTTINIGGIGVSVLLDNVEVSYGNEGCPNNPAFESGGSKFVWTDSLVVRNSFFHHSCGIGLWLDTDNINYTLENNRIEDNVREGIAIEISYKGVIRNNSVLRNGYATDPYRTQNWLWDAGIGVHASPDVEIYGNTVSGNFNGIVGIQQNRGTGRYGPYLLQNLYVHDNVITQNIPQGAGMENAAGGIVQDTGDNTVFTGRNNRYQNNTYYLLLLGGGQSPGFEWMGWKNDTQWKGYGMDATGKFNRS